MKNKFNLLVIVVMLICNNMKSQIFTLADSIKINNNAQIWGVISDKGDSLCLTTIFTTSGKPQIFLRKISYSNISSQGTITQLTTASDFASITNLTDHKHIILNNEIYIAFSTVGDADLYLFKTDINGNRIGNIVTVVTGSTARTNDMTLVSDGTSIFVKIFMPSNCKVFKFDTNLNSIGSALTLTTPAHNNLGTAVLHNGQFYNFSGSTFGHNSNLILTTWTTAWVPTLGSAQTLVSAVGGEGNFFSTGVAFDQANSRWYIGMNNLPSTLSANQEHIDILAMDTNFNVLQRKTITGNGYFRPHFVLKGNYLYVAYDKGGQGVFLEKYSITQTPTTNIQEEKNIFSACISPNPSNEKTALSFNLIKEENITISLLDINGKLVQSIANENMPRGIHKIEINTTKISAGIYFCKIQSNYGNQSVKLLVK